MLALAQLRSGLCCKSIGSRASTSRVQPSLLHPLVGSSAHFPLRQQQSAERGCGPAMASVKDLQSLPGVCATPDASTKDFIFQQTMLRVRDPQAALDFYTRVLGMTLLAKLDFPSMSFSLYFLAYEKQEDIPQDPVERARWMFGRPAVLELTHNWGTESDPEFKGYHNGNSEPRGFGHIGLAVPDVEAACKRFEELGVEFVKRPDDGKMKGLAFVKDPDGYWIEILNPAVSGALAAWKDE